MDGTSLFQEQPVCLGGWSFDQSEKNRFFMEMHKHDLNSEIFLVEEGEGEFEIDGVNRTVSAGNLLFYHRGVWHNEMSTKYPFRATYISFTGLKLRGLEPDFFLDRGTPPLISLDVQMPEIRKLMRECIAHYHKRESESELIANHYLGILFVRLAQLVHYRNWEEKTKKSAKEAVWKTRRHIEENYGSNVTLDSVAKAVYLNKYHLAHLFKEDVGTSPIQFLIYCRMEAAKRYLKTTRLPVKEIAGLVGYESEPSFYHVFMKMNGMTPKEYRNALPFISPVQNS